LDVTRISVETPDAQAADDLVERLDPLATHEVHRDEGRFELQIELGAVYESHVEHGRALASLLDAIHGWLDNQQAPSVDVLVDGRRLTIHAAER
jgi:hypothetical protein